MARREVCEVVTKALICSVLFGIIDGQTTCSFPSDIRGNWISSKKGLWTLDETHISGRIVCDETLCRDDVWLSWTCVERSGERYLIRSERSFDFSWVNFWVCLYLERVSATKYIYYQGPEAIHSKFKDNVISKDEGTTVTLASVCNLPTPLPTERYHILVKEDSIDTSSSFCPSDLLGYFVTSSSCDATLDVCQGDKDSIQVINSTTDPPLFTSKNGSLKCMYSLRDDATNLTYLTVYNQDTLSPGNIGFACAAIFKSGDQISLTQQEDHCIGLTSPVTSNQPCAFRITRSCPIDCQFPSVLTGSWLSTRKGWLDIAGGALSGFKPHGVDCNTTTCTNAPTTFQCYMTDDNMFLLRTEFRSMDSESVRIYVCLNFTMESSDKFIYHHDHSAIHGSLQEYVVTLNADAPVDDISVMCEYLTSYDPALYSVLLKSGSVSESIVACPGDLKTVFEISNSQCEHTIGTCDNDTALRISDINCRDTPFYTGNPNVNCLYSTKSESTTFLTLYNKEDNYSTGSIYKFTCMAYQVSSRQSSTLTSLRFSQTPNGCHKNQTPTNVTTNYGMTFAYEAIRPCVPGADDEFDWLMVAIAMAALCLVSIVGFIVWRRCKGKQTETNADVTQDPAGEGKPAGEDGEEKPAEEEKPAGEDGKEKTEGEDPGGSSHHGD